MTKLEEILSATRERVARARKQADPRLLEAEASAHQPRGFRKRLLAMSQLGPAVIAEIKKASPSKGLLRESFPVTQLAGQLARGGASALSVLTDEKYFQGSLENLLEASVATSLPCLRKDFILDEFQLLEARASHADAVLLILSALDDTVFRSLLERAKDCVVQRRQDQQDGVSVAGSCLQQLELVEDEIFAQAGQARRHGCFEKILERSLEVLLVGQNRERRCAAPGQLAGELRHGKRLPQQAFGRGCLLDLSNDRGTE